MELQGQTHPFMEKSTGGGGGVRGALVRSPVGIPTNQFQALKAPPFPFLGNFLMERIGKSLENLLSGSISLFDV